MSYPENRHRSPQIGLVVWRVDPRTGRIFDSVRMARVSHRCVVPGHRGGCGCSDEIGAMLWSSDGARHIPGADVWQQPTEADYEIYNHLRGDK